MPDQAFRLRALMHEDVPTAHAVALGTPRLIVVAGAKGGVGTTTVAVNLAIALAREGRRTLLVDADPQRADVAVQCGLSEGLSVVDVLSGLRSVHEAMRLGPAGIQILPGRWGHDPIAQWSPRATERLLGELRGLGAHTDIILLDIGAAVDQTARHFWRAADEVVLITSADGVAVMDAYAAVKTLFDPRQPTRVATLVNLATDPLAAQDAHDRLQKACRRFLRIDMRKLGSIPHDARIREAADLMRPFVTQAADCAASHELVRIVERLCAVAPTRRDLIDTMCSSSVASSR